MKFFTQILLFLAFTLSVFCAEINIKGLDKAALLRELWKNQFGGEYYLPAPFSDAEALEASKKYIDYFYDRPIKTDISGDVAESANYDRDAGKGVFAVVVKYLRRKNSL